MKRITCFLFYLCALIINVNAQTTDTVKTQITITGKLIDDKGSPLNFANVSLIRSKDSSLVTTSLSNAEGKFIITAPSAGSYFLNITSIGFNELKLASFKISQDTFLKDFGTITLKPEAKTLQNVSVTALRPNIVQLADRMVVSVEGTAMAAGNTAFAVLSRAPGVFIDADGNIQLNGKSGVTVMLDGKLTYLSARDLKTLLESMPAENLKNIEIITNPSAKYDAEGNSGILNINLRKNTQQGINGSISTTYNYNFQNQHGGTIGGNINHKSGKWNSFLNVDAARRVGGGDATFTRIFYAPNQTIYFDQVAEGNFLSQGPPSIRLGTDYSFNDMHSIGIMGSFVKNRGESDFITETCMGNAPKNPSQFIMAENISVNTYKNFTANLHYTGKLDTLGTVLTSDFDRVKISNRGYTDMLNYYTNLSTQQTNTDFLYQNTPSNFDIYSGKMDLVLPIQKVKIETGLKASRVFSENDFTFYFNNGSKVMDPSRTNLYKYNEGIYATYLNINSPLGKNFSAQAGLRMEHTRSVMNAVTIGDYRTRNYTDFFPSFFLQQKVNDNYGINYSYSRRLSRPSYGALNIFKSYRDPYTYTQGNPYLRPQYSNIFTVTQTIKRIYVITLNYNIFKDAMAEVPIIDVNEGVTIYTQDNLNNGHSMGLSAVAPLKIMKKWDSQNTMTLSYAKNVMQTNLGEVVNDQLFAMLQSNHTILLPKDLRMELSFLVRSAAANGLYIMAPMQRVDVAFKKSFINKKLDFTVNVVDVFKTFRYLWTTDIAGNVNDFDQYFRVRTATVSLRYNFSKGQKVEQKRRSAEVEEVNRTN